MILKARRRFRGHRHHRKAMGVEITKKMQTGVVAVEENLMQLLHIPIEKVGCLNIFNSPIFLVLD